jgi:ABC-type lipoprotein export system ATPase subunit
MSVAKNAGSARPATNFVEWLKSDSPVYWVSGKPGSGKSTFMKYLSTEDHTRDLLSSWSGMSELITASYFFWVAARNPL